MPRGGGRMGNPQQQVRFQSAASGADNAASGAGSAVMVDDVVASSAESWTRWRERFPIRPGAVVTPTSGGRPNKKSGQSAWSLYTAYHENGRVAQEWFMAPFLVATTEVTDVSYIDSDAQLLTYHVSAFPQRTGALLFPAQEEQDGGPKRRGRRGRSLASRRGPRRAGQKGTRGGTCPPWRSTPTWPRRRAASESVAQGRWAAC